MRPSSRLHLFLLLFALSRFTGALLGQTTTAPTVGSGAPSTQISDRFIRAYFRGFFPALTSLPPLADVHRLGTTGLVQEFPDAKKTSGVKYALVLANQANSGFEGDVVQVAADMYAYYTTVGVNTAGYPLIDTQPCPNVANCEYQLFTNTHALFVYSVATLNGTTFDVGGVVYAKWLALNGINGALGAAADTLRTLTSSSGVGASYQGFQGGTVVNITSGTLSGQVLAVLGGINDLYQFYGGPSGALGLPTSDEVSLSGGVHRQTFEFGRVQYVGSGTPAILFPVSQIQIAPAAPFSLSFGQHATVTATASDTRGQPAVGRTYSWTTSNGRAVTVSANNETAVLNAVGGGTALITVTSEGKVSNSLLVTVNQPCCAVGEGAPSAVIQSAFQDAVARAALAVQIPAASPVRRVPTGYAQDLLGLDGATRYLVAKSDLSSLAYTLSGPTLSAYLILGGVSGALGLPASDRSPGGTQLFENSAALAGAPVRLVTGAVLSKWASLNYEAGSAGAPTGDAVAFTSQSAYTGASQAFAGGVIFGLASGSRAGQGYLVSGPVLSRYNALGGPTGSLGIPITDDFANGPLHQQNFENGYLDYAPGAATAAEHLVPRTPAVLANPATALAGSRLHLAVSGFANGATLRVSVSGQPDFTVSAPAGSYDWDVLVPTSAAAGTVTIHAVDASTGAAADGSYIIRSLLAARVQIAKVAGDNQTAAGASVLAQPLTVKVMDGSGIPLAGVTVQFSASPGAQVAPASALTDASGQARTSLRLPSAAGISAVNARALGQLVIFNAQATASSGITGLPRFSPGDYPQLLGNGTASIAQSGSLLLSAAALVRYYQNRGAVPAAHGLADPLVLNQFLRSLCVPGNNVCDGFLTNPDTGEQVLNLWRLASFTGGGLDVSIENPILTSVRDLVAAGDPVLLTLAITVDSAPAGGIAVIVNGVAADGTLLLLDAVMGRASLSAYLDGFVSAGHIYKGVLLSAARLLPRAPSSSGILVSAISQPFDPRQQSLEGLSLAAASANGSCGLPFYLPDTGAPRASEFLYCDGSQPLYQVTAASAQSYRASITDLASGGTTAGLSGPVAGFQLTRPAGALVLAPPAVTFSDSTVLNAASFSTGIAPGGIVSIFGAGLAGPGVSTTVTANGEPATVLFASAFQVNVQLPADLAPGTVSLALSSAFGSASRDITLQSAAPGIFVLGTSAEGNSQGAVVNPDGALNSAAAPVPRGGTLVIYGTNLGAVAAGGQLFRTITKVSALVGVTELPVAFAGLTPGFVGLYQVNLMIPSNTPPGLFLPLALRAAGVDSNIVIVAVQ